jgi:hypothetical protein
MEVGLGVHVPVDLPRVIAGVVLAVLAELHGKTVVRRVVQAREKTLDDEARLQVQPPDLADDVGAKILFNGQRHCKLPIVLRLRSAP